MMRVRPLFGQDLAYFFIKSKKLIGYITVEKKAPGVADPNYGILTIILL